MKPRTAFFNLLGSIISSKPVLNPTKLLHRYLIEMSDDVPWTQVFKRLAAFNGSALKTVIEQGFFVVIVVGVLGLLVFNGLLWLNPGLRESVIVQQYTDQSQSHPSPGYYQSSGQSPSVSFSQRLYTP